MTLNQLQTLTDDELAIALYVVNHLSPPGIPPGPFDARDLTWFKHAALTQKLVDSFHKIKPEGHATFTSLMEKLGVKVEITQPPQSPEAPPPEAPLPEAPLPEAPLPEAPLPEAPLPEAPLPEAPLTGSI